MSILRKKGKKIKQEEEGKKLFLSGQCPDPRDQVQAPSLLYFQPPYSQSQEQSFHLQSLPHFSLLSQLWSQDETLLAHASSCL